MYSIIFKILIHILGETNDGNWFSAQVAKRCHGVVQDQRISAKNEL